MFKTLIICHLGKLILVARGPFGGNLQSHTLIGKMISIFSPSSFRPFQSTSLADQMSWEIFICWCDYCIIATSLFHCCVNIVHVYIVFITYLLNLCASERSSTFEVDPPSPNILSLSSQT